jgi:hypothetical protein
VPKETPENPDNLPPDPPPVENPQKDAPLKQNKPVGTKNIKDTIL